MNIKITINNDRRQVPVISQTVRHFCISEGAADRSALNQIELAVVELLTNIFDHGNLKPESEVKVHCRFKGAVLTVDFTDNGRALSDAQANLYMDDMVNMPEAGDDIDDLPVNGWGIQLIKAACDRVSYKRNGPCNNYTLVFDLSMAVT